VCGQFSLSRRVGRSPLHVYGDHSFVPKKTRCGEPPFSPLRKGLWPLKRVKHFWKRAPLFETLYPKGGKPPPFPFYLRKKGIFLGRFVPLKSLGGEKPFLGPPTQRGEIFHRGVLWKSLAANKKFGAKVNRPLGVKKSCVDPKCQMLAQKWEKSLWDRMKCPQKLTNNGLWKK